MMAVKCYSKILQSAPQRGPGNPTGPPYFDCRSKEALDYYRQLEEEERQQREAAEKAAEAASAAESFKLLDIDGDGIIRYSL